MSHYIQYRYSRNYSQIKKLVCILGDVQTLLQETEYSSLPEIICHLCQFPVKKGETKVKCHCNCNVHDDCYKGRCQN